MGHDSVGRGMNPDQVGRSEWIETFRSRSRRDLRAGWRRSGAAQPGFFLDESWGSCLLYTSPSPRDYAASRMPSSA